VTHDESLARLAPRRIDVRDGRANEVTAGAGALVAD
jgi:ABC-type lipoprotein export system ATPase subunit